MIRGLDKQVWAWAFYDWANSAFATVIMAGFFPVFFKQFWAHDLSVSESTFQLGLASSIASFIVVLIAPFLGAITDQGSYKKRFLITFAAMGMVMTFALYFVSKGNWQLAVWLYIASTIGFMGSNVFYDALLPMVSQQKRVDFVSAMGYALGYLGGGLLFLILVVLTLNPGWLGFQYSSDVVRLSFVCVAIWWMLFSLPMVFLVKEPFVQSRKSLVTILKGSFLQLHHTVIRLSNYRSAVIFLIAYWLYIDGVDTIVRMAVDYGLSIGLDSNSLITALLITQFVGFPAALFFGRLGERIGPKKGIYIAILIYTAVTLWAAFIDQAFEFYLLAFIVGLVQGGIQALSRSFFVRLIPVEMSGEFFGFYNMLGKFAAVIGPVAIGWVSVLTGNPRYSILALLALFIAGLFILKMVKVPDARDIARD